MSTAHATTAAHADSAPAARSTRERDPARAHARGIDNLGVQRALAGATGRGDFQLGAHDAPEERQAREVARAVSARKAAAAPAARDTAPHAPVIHDDPTAHAAAAALATRAFTAQGHMFFARGQYRPHSADGRRLLAHETTHALAHRGERVVRRDDPPSGSPVLAIEPDLLASYPHLAIALAPDDVKRLQDAADKRAESRRIHAESGAPTVGTPITLEVPLADLIEPDALFTDIDCWPTVFAIFQDQSDPQLAGEMIRNEIMRRFFVGNGMPVESEQVTITLNDPDGALTGAATLRFEVAGLAVRDSGGMITALAIDAALESVTRLATVSAEVAGEARELGDVANLHAQKAALDQSIPAYLAEVRADFAGHSLASLRAGAARLQGMQRSADSMASSSFGGAYIGDVGAGLKTHVASLATLQAEAQDWHGKNQPELTAGENYRALGTDLAGVGLREYDAGGAGGYALGTLAFAGAGATAIFEGLDNMLTFGFQSQEADIAEAYRRGDISQRDMTDLTESAAIRAAVTGIVTIALTIATAGIGGAVAGGLGLARGTLSYAIVGAGFEGALGNVAALGTSTLLTSVRSYDDPMAQAIWSSGGAQSGWDFGRDAAIGFGFGSLMGVKFGYGGYGSSRALAPSANSLLEGAASAGPRWSTKSLGIDPLTGMEMHWGQHNITGEVFEVAVNPKTGSGYVHHVASGYKRTFGPGGFDAAPAGLLGSGDTPIVMGGDGPLTFDPATMGNGSMLVDPAVSPLPGALTPDAQLAAQSRIALANASPELAAAADNMFGARAPLQLTAGADPVVWVNTRSSVFHYDASPWFNNTQSGVALPRSVALEMGMREAGAPRMVRQITPYRSPAGVQMESSGAAPRGSAFISARAQTAPSMITATGADVAEGAAYQHSLRAGEYGLGRPAGANVPGSDYITATRVDGKMQIYVNDAKYSTTGNFPEPSDVVPRTWRREVWDAISSRRLNLGDAALEAEIREAFAAGRVSRRQVNVAYPAGGNGGEPVIVTAQPTPRPPLVTPPPKSP